MKLKKKLANVWYADLKLGKTVEGTVKMASEIGGVKTKNPFPNYVNLTMVDRDYEYGPEMFTKSVDPCTLLKLKTYEEIERLFYGADDPAEEDEGDVSMDEAIDREQAAPVQHVEHVEPPKTIGVPPKTEAPKGECAHGLRFGKDFNQDDVCADVCDAYLRCQKANKELAAK